MQFKEDIENFERNRQNYENEYKLCSLIRDDSVSDFIQYINERNLSFSTQIKRSFFETNSMFIEKDPTLIEYAAFFGSIQILKYLVIKDVELEPSIWLYAVHSDNAEIIQFLEEKKIEMDDRTFSEAVKCHHNEIARYIRENYADNIANFNDEIYSSSNYEFFECKIDGNEIFFSLCKNGYYELINLYLALKKEEIEKYENECTNCDTMGIIQTALTQNRLDVVYHSLM